jgi:hypothetical protein
MLLIAVTGWLAGREREMLAYLIEENRVLRRQLARRRLRLADEDRRKLAACAYRVGRRPLRNVATIVTPDTLLRWLPTHCPQMDLPIDSNTSSRHPRRNQTVGQPDGGGESDVGVHADPRRAEECRAGWPVRS